MSKKVLIEAIEQALKPLKKSIIDQYYKMYAVKERYNEDNVDLHDLLDFAYCILSEVEELDED